MAPIATAIIAIPGRPYECLNTLILMTSLLIAIMLSLGACSADPTLRKLKNIAMTVASGMGSAPGYPSLELVRLSP
jgi:hypothetical protein